MNTTNTTTFTYKYYKLTNKTTGKIWKILSKECLEYVTSRTMHGILSISRYYDIEGTDSISKTERILYFKDNPKESPRVS